MVISNFVALIFIKTLPWLHQQNYRILIKNAVHFFMQMDPLASGGDPETAGGAADGAFVIVAGDVVGDGNEGQFAVLVGARVSMFGGQTGLPQLREWN